MKSFLIWVVILVVLGTAIIFSKDYVIEQARFFLLPEEGETVPTLRMKARNYQLIIPAQGNLSGLQTVPLMTPRVRTGSLKISSMVDEGSVVQKDQVVILFDETDAKLSLEESENKHASFSYQIERTQENSEGEMEVLTMEQIFADTELNYARSQIRIDDEIFSRWEIQESLMSAALAEYKKKVLGRKVELKEGLSESDLRILSIDQQKAAMEIDLAKETLSSLSLTSPVDGIVIYKRRGFDELEVGTEVWPGQPLADIVSLHQFKGTVQVLEKDIGAIEAGSRADVRLDAFPDQVFSAKVQRIARIAKQKHREDPRKFFECELLLEVPVDLMESMKPGMRFDSEILGGSWQNAFVLPKSAVLKQEKGWIVYLSKEGSYQEQKVELISSDHGFCLVSGLQEGDVVCLRHPFEKQKLVMPDFSAPATASQTTRFVIFN